MKKIRSALSLLVLLGCAAVVLAQRQPTGQLQVSGSTTMQPLMTEIAKRFQSLHPGVRIDVRAGGSGRGVSDIREGKTDIGMVSRIFTEKERDLYGIPIARDGVAVMVHKDNPVTALSTRQLADIYTGKISNWRQVGGRDAAILVLSASPDRGSSELFLHYLGLSHEQIKYQRLVEENAERIKAISGNPLAIIYMSVGEAERNALAGAPIKLLPADGVAASSKLVRSGDFPISRPLMLVTKDVPRGLAREFIEFSISSQVTDLIRALDFVPYMD